MLAMIFMDWLLSVYRDLFLGIDSVIGSLGWSLILLSFIISVVLSPLVRLAGRMVNRENEIVSVISPQIERIKRECSGEQQHRRIQNLYRRYSYSPFMALRKVMPLFIQLPALFITYYMLKDLAELKGTSFFILKDLSLEDNLINGVNLLPILMTVFNLIAAFTTPHFTKKDLMQVSTIAFLFFVLLYKQSSGLLLYWTTNNAILMFRNVYLWFQTNKKETGNLGFDIIFCNIANLVKSRYFVALCLYLFTLFSVNQIYWGYYVDRYLGQDVNNTHKILIGIILTIPLICSLISFSCIRCRHKVFYGIFILQIVSIIFIGLCFPREGIAALGALTIASFLIFAFSADYEKISTTLSKLRTKLSNTHLNWLSTGCFVYCLFVLLVDNPLSTYSSSPEEFFSVPLVKIMAAYWVVLISSALIFFFFVKFAPGIIKEFTLSVLFFLAVIVFLYSKIVVLNYGAMSLFRFHLPEALILKMIFSTIESIFLIGLFGFVLLNLSKITSHLTKTLCLLFFVSVVSVGVNVVAIAKKHSVDREQVEDIFADAKDLKLQFSSNDNNVLIFLFDGFSGGVLPTVMNLNPEVGKSLKDFTWYKNTLSSGGSTVGSIPGMVGGHKYTVESIIKSKNDHVDDVMRDAYPVMPQAFEQRGYDTVWVNQPYAPLSLPQLNLQRYSVKLEDFSKKNMNSFVGKMLLVLSVFKSVPLFKKEFIYNGGRWHFLNDTSSLRVMNASKFADIDFLEQLPSIPIIVQENPTYTFVYLSPPHAPWVVTKYDGTESDSDDPYVNESRYCLEQFGQLMESMKEAGVYDNTLVMIVSDHGWMRAPDVKHEMFSPSFCASMAGRSPSDRMKPGLLHALLLVKQPHESFNCMRESDVLASTSDVPSIVCEVIGGCAGVRPNLLKMKGERELIYSFVSFKIWTEKGHFGDYLKEQWSVKNSIFDEKNWRKID